MEISRGEAKSIGEIEPGFSLSQATVTDILDRLELKGLISRSGSTVDKRRMTVRLTPQGVQVLSKSPSLLQAQFLSRLDKLEDWEKTSILSSLQQVAAMMKADVLIASPLLDISPIPKTDETVGDFLSADLADKTESEKDGTR